MILTKKISVTIPGINYVFYKQKYPEIKMHSTIIVDVNELPKNSPLKIECRCEICKNIKIIPYRKYLFNKNRQDYYSCKHCKNLKTFKTKKERYGSGNYNNSKQMIKTKEEKNIYISATKSKPFQLYRKMVGRFTYKYKKLLYENWDGYDYYDAEYIKDYFQLKSSNMKYPTIDHKISLFQGFTENIAPYIIGDINNLCITKREINLKKSSKILNITS